MILPEISKWGLNQVNYVLNQKIVFLPLFTPFWVILAIFA